MSLLEARCTCQGDPHCWSFDDRRHDYQGMCIYTLVRDQCRNGIPIAPSKFDIVGDFKIRDGARTTVSMMKVMHIRLHEERNLVSSKSHPNITSCEHAVGAVDTFHTRLVKTVKFKAMISQFSSSHVANLSAWWSWKISKNVLHITPMIRKFHQSNCLDYL